MNELIERLASRGVVMSPVRGPAEVGGWIAEDMWMTMTMKMTMTGKHEFGVIDDYGAEIVPFGYAELTVLAPSHFGARTAQSRSYSTWDVFSRDGRLLVAGADRQCGQIKPFSEGLAAAQMGGRWGYVDTDGATAVESAFDSASDFHEGRAFVTAAKRTYCIDRAGQALFEAPSRQVEDYSEGYAVFTGKDGKKGVIDGAGIVVVPPVFVDVKNCRHGRFAFAQKKGRGLGGGARWGVMDAGGRVVVPAEYGHAQVEGGQIKYGWFNHYGQTAVFRYTIADLDGNTIQDRSWLEVTPPADGLRRFTRFVDPVKGKVEDLLIGYLTEDSRQIVITRADSKLQMDHPLKTAPMDELITAHSQGLAFARRYNTIESNPHASDGRYILIDRQGQPVSWNGFTEVIWGFQGGFACVKGDPRDFGVDKHLCFFIDTAGNRVSPAYGGAERMPGGRIFARPEESVFHYEMLDEALNRIAPGALFPSPGAFWGEDLYVGSDRGRLWLFDRQGETILSPDDGLQLELQRLNPDMGPRTLVTLDKTQFIVHLETDTPVAD
ncbi:MAG: WG repeat-containing protein [Bifidobacteriaceae bacterium]|jgi:hypothetical protein|nr:WG repeat-containing protein [Bifidobacteriaceae bacterium]